MCGVFRTRFRRIRGKRRVVVEAVGVRKVAERETVAENNGMAACSCGDIGKFLIEGGKRSKIRGGVCLVFIRMLRVEAAEGITELLDNPHCIFRRGPDVLVLFAVGFVRMIMGRFVVCILVLMVVYILVICIFVLMVVRILVLMIVCVAVGLHSLDGFLGNGVNAVHQRHYLFVRGIDRIKDCLDPGIGIAADVDEEITFGNRNHIARGVHDKKSLEEKLLQLQNADDTLDVGVMMFDMNNLKMINDTYGHEEGDVFIQTFASYLTRILTENSFLARFGGDEFVIVQNHATWNQLEQMNLQLQTMIDTYNQTADHPLSYAVGYELSCKNHYYLIMDLLQMADEKMYQDKRYKKQLQKNGPLAARRSMLAESISTDSLKEKIFTLLNNRSEEKQYAFLMTDVDNFHLINDYWGYETGTNILNFILKKLELFPQTLFVNRYHSDIFVGIIDITWQDPAVVREKISAYHKQAIRFFHDRNIRISMDDFGSGYSSLNSLKDILFDEVKIDKHFLSAGLSEKEKI